MNIYRRVEEELLPGAELGGPPGFRNTAGLRKVNDAGSNLIGSRNRLHLRFAWGLEPFLFQSVHLND